MESGHAPRGWEFVATNKVNIGPCLPFRMVVVTSGHNNIEHFPAVACGGGHGLAKYRTHSRFDRDARVWRF